MESLGNQKELINKNKNKFMKFGFNAEAPKAQAEVEQDEDALFTPDGEKKQLKGVMDKYFRPNTEAGKKARQLINGAVLTTMIVGAGMGLIKADKPALAAEDDNNEKDKFKSEIVVDSSDVKSEIVVDEPILDPSKDGIVPEAEDNDVENLDIVSKKTWDQRESDEIGQADRARLEAKVAAEGHGWESMVQEDIATGKLVGSQEIFNLRAVWGAHQSEELDTNGEDVGALYGYDKYTVNEMYEIAKDGDGEGNYNITDVLRVRRAFISAETDPNEHGCNDEEWEAAQSISADKYPEYQEMTDIVDGIIKEEIPEGDLTLEQKEELSHHIKELELINVEASPNTDKNMKTIASEKAAEAARATNDIEDLLRALKVMDSYESDYSPKDSRGYFTEDDSYRHSPAYKELLKAVEAKIDEVDGARELWSNHCLYWDRDNEEMVELINNSERE